MSNIKPQFKRCPFCGHDLNDDYWPMTLLHVNVTLTTSSIRCTECGASGPIVSNKDGSKAIELWNKRYYEEERKQTQKEGSTDDHNKRNQTQ